MIGMLLALVLGQEIQDNIEQKRLYLCSVAVEKVLMRPVVFEGEGELCEFTEFFIKDSSLQMVCLDSANPHAGEIKGGARMMRRYMLCDTHEEGRIKPL